MEWCIGHRTGVGLFHSSALNARDEQSSPFEVTRLVISDPFLTEELLGLLRAFKNHKKAFENILKGILIYKYCNII